MNRSGTKHNRLQLQSTMDQMFQLQNPWMENQLLLESAGAGTTDTLTFPVRSRHRGSQYRIRR